MDYRIDRINRFMTGWIGYFHLADMQRFLQQLLEHTRKRLRQIMWKHWKRPRTRIRNLVALGIPRSKAYEWGNSSKGYWRVAGSWILTRSLTNQYWEDQGLKSFIQRWETFRWKHSYSYQRV